MNADQFLKDQAEAIALVNIVSAPEPRAIAFKIAYCLHVLVAGPTQAEVPWDEVLNLLEDLKVSLSESETRTLLTESGLAEELDGRLVLPSLVCPKASDGSVLRGLSRERIIDLLSPAPALAAQEQSFDLMQCVERIQGATAWVADVASSAQAAGLKGIPVFWECADGGHAPFSPDPGTLTTADSLLLAVERCRYGLPLPYCSQEDASSILWIWRMLLSLQVHERKWHEGAFSVPTWDDDFFGSFLDRYKDEGPCPTVDASGGAVVALCAALRSGLANLLPEDQKNAIENLTRDAIRSGVDFLLRMQLQEGAWPIFRYEGDTFAMPPRDLSSRYAIEALAEATKCGLLPELLARDALQASRRYLEWTIERSHSDPRGRYWNPNYFKPVATDEEKVETTANIWLTFEAACEAWPSLRSCVNDLRQAVIAFVEETWIPNESGFARIEFRVPTWDGPADTRFPWEWPRDPIVVSMLLTSERSAPVLSAQGHGKILNAIAGFLPLGIHGHWDDYLMKREGRVRAMPANTQKFCRALLDFITWQQTSAARALGSQV